MKFKQNTPTLNKLFPLLNSALFEGELEKPIVRAVNLIEMLGMTVINFGYKDKEGFAGLTIVDKHGNQFVAVVSGHETYADFVATFAHELIHIWQSQNGLEMNHKKEFKKMCRRASKLLKVKVK